MRVHIAFEHGFVARLFHQRFPVGRFGYFFQRRFPEADLFGIHPRGQQHPVVADVIGGNARFAPGGHVGQRAGAALGCGADQHTHLAVCRLRHHGGGGSRHDVHMAAQQGHHRVARRAKRYHRQFAHVHTGGFQGLGNGQVGVQAAQRGHGNFQAGGVALELRYQVGGGFQGRVGGHGHQRGFFHHHGHWHIVAHVGFQHPGHLASNAAGVKGAQVMSVATVALQLLQ